MDGIGYLLGMIVSTGLFVGVPCFLVAAAGFRLSKGAWLPLNKILASVALVIVVSGIAYTIIGSFLPYGAASLLILVVIPLLVSVLTLNAFYSSKNAAPEGS